MKVSIIIPVYNSSKYIAETLSSIWQQTFSDYEVIVVDDHSTDDSKSICEKIAENHATMRVVTNEFIKGLSGARNTGINHAAGEYLALIDSDDLMLPQRLEKQVAFLDKNPDIGVLGTWIQEFDGGTELWKEPTDPEYAKAKLIICPPIANPSAMIRKSVLQENGVEYRTEYDYAEDYDLWVQLMDITKFSNIPEVLTLYRIRKDSVSNAGHARMIESWKRTLSRILGRLGIVEISEEMFEILDLFDTQNTIHIDAQKRAVAEKVCVQLIEANKKTSVFSQAAFEKLLDDKLMQISVTKEI